MDTVLDTVMTIAAMAVVCMMLELLLPKSTLKSSVMIIIGIAFLLTAAVPIINLINRPSLPVSEQPAGIETDKLELQPYQDFLFDIIRNID